VVRGPVREQAILDATIALLGEVGYGALTMDAVAQRARASKMTIYRRCERVDDRYATMMTGLVHAMRLDADLAAALRSHVTDGDLGPFKQIVERATARGEVPAGISPEQAHQVAEGQIMRRMILGQPLDHAFVTDLIDNLLVPLLTRTFPAAMPGARPAAPTGRE